MWDYLANVQGRRHELNHRMVPLEFMDRIMDKGPTSLGIVAGLGSGCKREGEQLRR